MSAPRYPKYSVHGRSCETFQEAVMLAIGISCNHAEARVHIMETIDAMSPAHSLAIYCNGERCQ